MNQRRQSYDPLAPSAGPRWLARVDEYRNVVEVLELPAWANLRDALAEGIERLRRNGWEIEGVSYSWTFVRREGVRHNLSIVPTDPGKPPGNMWGDTRR